MDDHPRPQGLDRTPPTGRLTAFRLLTRTYMGWASFLDTRWTHETESIATKPEQKGHRHRRRSYLNAFEETVVGEHRPERQPATTTTTRPSILTRSLRDL